MYSLYRAWLLRENSPPDVIVCVGSATGRGSHQFSGHRNVLSSHSGYLKSLLAETQSEADSEGGPTHREIVVPNVSAEVFAPLLTFMYTGYLELTPDNIYGVLLATHLLHMPRALDLCRSYLLQQQHSAQLPPPPPLVKPIPSRKMLPVLLPPPPSTTTPGVYWPPPPPPPYHPLPPITDDPSGYRSVFPLVLSKPETQINVQPPPPSPSPPPPLPSTSDGRPGTPLAARQRSSVSPSLSQASDSSDRVTVTVTHRSKSKKHHNRRNLLPGDGKVIVDVACCDGPVRFHRVLNTNYGIPSRNQSLTNQKKRNRAAAAAATAAAENENGTAPNGDGDNGGATTLGVFTCRFCNHTFKSHYCYQKHARRHINPVDPEPQVNATSSCSADQHHTPVITTEPTSTTPPPPTPPPPPPPAPPPPPPQQQPQQQQQQPQQQREHHGHKREVRLLDMNVQYYPCKTCGSKFPSYYFVHKHRKMCHPGDDSSVANSHSQDTTTSSTD